MVIISTIDVDVSIHAESARRSRVGMWAAASGETFALGRWPCGAPTAASRRRRRGERAGGRTARPRAGEGHLERCHAVFEALVRRRRRVEGAAGAQQLAGARHHRSLHRGGGCGGSRLYAAAACTTHCLVAQRRCARARCPRLPAARPPPPLVARGIKFLERVEDFRPPQRGWWWSARPTRRVAAPPRAVRTTHTQQCCTAPYSAAGDAGCRASATQA